MPRWCPSLGRYRTGVACKCPSHPMQSAKMALGRGIKKAPPSLRVPTCPDHFGKVGRGQPLAFVRLFKLSQPNFYI